MSRRLTLLARAGILLLVALFALNSAAIAAPPGYVNSRTIQAQRYLRALRARRAAAARARRRATSAAQYRRRANAAAQNLTTSSKAKSATTKKSTTTTSKSKTSSKTAARAAALARSRRLARAQRSRRLYFARDAGTRYGSPAWQTSALLVMLEKTVSLLPGQARNWVAPPVTKPYKGQTIVLHNSVTGADATYHIQQVEPTRVSATLTAPSHRFQLVLRRSTGVDWRLAAVKGI